MAIEAKLVATAGQNVWQESFLLWNCFLTWWSTWLMNICKTILVLQAFSVRKKDLSVVMCASKLSRCAILHCIYQSLIKCDGMQLIFFLSSKSCIQVWIYCFKQNFEIQFIITYWNIFKLPKVKLDIDRESVIACYICESHECGHVECYMSSEKVWCYRIHLLIQCMD